MTLIKIDMLLGVKAWYSVLHSTHRMCGAQTQTKKHYIKCGVGGRKDGQTREQLGAHTLN